MPKSKRNRPVTLSKTKKKGREHKEAIVESIREAVEKYSSIYVFAFENMRNLKFKEFREQLKSTSRFFLGSNKVMQVALGRSASDEIKSGLHKISKFLRGDTGLFLTNMSEEEVKKCNHVAYVARTLHFASSTRVRHSILRHGVFGEFEVYDFARTGSLATEKVELKEGPLSEFSHEMEPFLRKQGMPVRLNKGVVELISDFVVCEEGKPLSPEASRILRLLGMKLAVFKLHLICRLSDDNFKVFREDLDESDIEAA